MYLEEQKYWKENEEIIKKQMDDDRERQLKEWVNFFSFCLFELGLKLTSFDKNRMKGSLMSMMGIQTTRPSEEQPQRQV